MYRLELLGFRDVADDVASRSLAKAFGIGIDEAERWVSSAPVKVRSNVDVETASEYAGALVRIGADVLVRNNETGDEKVYRGRDLPVTAPNAQSPFSSHAPPTNPQSAITPEHPADSGAEGAFETDVNPAIYESSGWDTAEVADMSADPVPGPASDMDGDALTRPISKVGGDAELEDFETAEPTVEREFSSLPTDDLDWVSESTKRDPSADDPYDPRQRPSWTGSGWDHDTGAPPSAIESKPQQTTGLEVSSGGVSEAALASATFTAPTETGELQLSQEMRAVPEPKPLDRAGLGDTVLCPQCGFSQPASDSCLRCGIVFAKYDPARVRPSPTPVEGIHTQAQQPGVGNMATLSADEAAALSAASSPENAEAGSSIREAVEGIVKRLGIRVVVGILSVVAALAYFTLESAVTSLFGSGSGSAAMPAVILDGDASYTLVVESDVATVLDISFYAINVVGGEEVLGESEEEWVSFRLEPGRHVRTFRAPEDLGTSIEFYAADKDLSSAGPVTVSLSAQTGEPAEGTISGQDFVEFGSGSLCARRINGAFNGCGVLD